MEEKVKTSNKSDRAPLTVEQRAQAKRARFLRLAPKRVDAALKRIAAVANLGNKASYQYSDAEAEKIMRALLGAVEAVRLEFVAIKPKDTAFTL